MGSIDYQPTMVTAPAYIIRVTNKKGEHFWLQKGEGKNALVHSAGEATPFLVKKEAYKVEGVDFLGDKKTGYAAQVLEVKVSFQVFTEVSNAL